MTTEERSTPISTLSARPLVRLTSVSRSFDTGTLALDRVSLAVGPGEIHALLGPNGAGKSTLLRILCNLVEPTSGDVDVLGLGRTISGTGHKGDVNLVPSGDRTFYLRLSGLENLIFFSKLYGLSSRQARRRALECLADVDLTDVARQPVATYSHGMQKRLSVARAMLTRPRLLLVDEATHDLDPHAATVVQQLVRSVAEQGTAVLWATQRLDEIRSFAHQVTVLDKGRVRFQGTVLQLQAEALTQRFVLHLDVQDGVVDHALLRSALAGSAVVEALEDDAEHVVVFVGHDHVLGEAITRLTQAGVRVLSCREERSGIEAAFLAVTGQREEA